MRSNEEMISSLARLIAVPSVTRRDPSGRSVFGIHTERALDEALDICRELGFRTKNCGYQTGWAEIGSGDEIVGILCHLDVVPEGEGWTKDPYCLTRENGLLYGRGTADDKGPAVSAVYAMKDILDEGIELKRRVRIIFGLSEEYGTWDDMEYYKSHEEMPAFGFTPDGDYPVLYAEKGILRLDLSMDAKRAGILSAEAGTAPNVVPHKCGIRFNDLNGAEISVKGTGEAAHGSMPYAGRNAIDDCFRNAASIGIRSSFLDFYLEKIEGDVYGRKLGIDFSDDKSGPLTVNAGMLKTENGMVDLTLDIRCPVELTDKEVFEKVSKACFPYSVSVAQTMWNPPLYVDKESPLIQILLQTYRDMTGDMKSQPKAIGGGTYAKAMDNIVAFGAAFPDKENSEHMSDEHIFESDLILNRRIYKEAILRLAQAESVV